MSEKDIEREILELRETTRKIASSKEKAHEFLLSLGIYTEDGQLKSEFR